MTTSSEMSVYSSEHVPQRRERVGIKPATDRVKRPRMLAMEPAEDPKVEGQKKLCFEIEKNFKFGQYVKGPTRGKDEIWVYKGIENHQVILEHIKGDQQVKHGPDEGGRFDGSLEMAPKVFWEHNKPEIIQ